ncbi:MAG: hypothetical protein IKE20_01615, partial [Eggerthellaceae bacterium]|nr:hypothetical protein [Eggerthellaceae bacterium]
LGPPVMKALAGGGDALDERSAWIPVVKGWTSTRDFDILSTKRFTTWFKNHEKLPTEQPKQNEEGGEQ